jgi:hypothetical protein
MHTHSPNKPKNVFCQKALDSCFLWQGMSANCGIHATRNHNNVSPTLRNNKKTAQGHSEQRAWNADIRWSAPPWQCASAYELGWRHQRITLILWVPFGNYKKPSTFWKWQSSFLPKLLIGNKIFILFAMLGNTSGFVTLVKEEAPHVVVTHWFLQVINYIRSRYPNHRIFETFCKEIGAEYECFSTTQRFAGFQQGKYCVCSN